MVQRRQKDATAFLSSGKGNHHIDERYTQLTKAIKNLNIDKNENNIINSVAMLLQFEF